MNKIFCIFLILALVLGLQVSCSDDEPKPVHVYLAGTYYNGSKYVACYWKDGVRTDLSPNEGTLGEATSIVVSGDDVYVGGYTFDNATQKGTALYWKNGVPVLMTNGTEDAAVYSIDVSGTDVYVAGYEKVGGTYVARYWRNGVATDLTTGTINGYASAIVVKNNIVYVAGRKGPGESNATVPKYWVNGVETSLTEETKSGYTTGISVSGSKVYVSGRIDDTPTKGVYWENGSPVTLSENAYSSSVSVNGNDVYTAGNVRVNGDYVPVYWKNNNKIDLNFSDEVSYAEAYGIYVFKGKVYVAGNQRIDSKYIATYWVNGKPEVLLDEEIGSAFGYAIFVTH